MNESDSTKMVCCTVGASRVMCQSINTAATEVPMQSNHSLPILYEVSYVERPNHLEKNITEYGNLTLHGSLLPVEVSQGGEGRGT